MDIRTMRYFMIVAQEENMTTAAEILHVTQPTLSRQIADLEKELGCLLFERTNRRTVLNEDGRHLYKKFSEILAMVDETSSEFRNRDRKITGEVSIGAGESRTVDLMASAMKNLLKAHPDVLFRIHSANSASILSRLDSDELDFGLLFEPVSLENYRHLRVPARERLGVLTTADHPLAEKGFVTAEDLASYPLIMVAPRSLDRHTLSRLFGLPADAANIVGYGNLIYNVSRFVQAGIGIALTIDGLTYTGEGSPLRFLPVRPERYRSQILLWKKKKELSRAAQLFLSEMIGVCSSYSNYRE